MGCVSAPSQAGLSQRLLCGCGFHFLQVDGYLVYLAGKFVRYKAKGLACSMRSRPHLCSGGLVIDDEVGGRLGSPQVHGILRRMVAALPNDTGGNVVDVRGVFSITPP